MIDSRGHELENEAVGSSMRANRETKDELSEEVTGAISKFFCRRKGKGSHVVAARP